MIPSPNKCVGSPIIELPPRATASSIADLLVGSWNPGDYSSDMMAARASCAPVAFATVTVPLAIIERLSHGMFPVPTLLVENSLCYLAALGMSPAAREEGIQRAVTGQAQSYRPPRLQAWVGVDRRPSQTCVNCEWTGWRDFGVRAILCPHQIPFVTACFACGNVLTRRVMGASAKPPGSRFKAADRIALRFAQVAERLAMEANSPSAVRARLLALLTQAGYVYPHGDYRCDALSRDFTVFCRDAVTDPCLRNLAQYPLRVRTLLSWISQGGRTVHPAFVILLDLFLQTDGSYGSVDSRYQTKGAPVRSPVAERHSGSTTATRARKVPIDAHKQYVRDDLPELVGAGCTRREMAELLHISKSTVATELRRQDLREHCKQMQYARKIAEARARWLALRDAFPNLRPYTLAKMDINLVNWLFSKDRTWFREHSRSTAVPPCQRLPKHGPKGQHARLTQRIRAASRRIRACLPARWCSIQAILKETGMSIYALDRARRMQPHINGLVLSVTESRAEFYRRKKAQESR